MKLRKKLLLSGAICLLLASSTVPSFASVRDGNWKDSTFVFHFGQLNGSRYTDPRPKLNDTSAYMKCRTLSKVKYHYDARVYGCKDRGKDAEDCSRGHIYAFVEGTTRKLVNYVHENKKSHAQIRANAGFNISKCTATGFWSPDSI